MMTKNGPATPSQNRLSPEDLAALTPVRTPRREVHAGVFVIGGLIALLLVLFTLTDPGMFRGRYHVSALVDDAQGIRRGDPVQLQGVNIGRVRGFHLGADGVEVRLELQRAYPVPVDSRASLASGGILGDMVLTITPGESQEVLREGSRLAVDREGGGGLMDAAGSVAGRADDVLLRMQQALSEQTITAMAATAQDLQALTAELAAMAVEQRGQMAALTASLSRSATGLESAATRPELAQAVARTDSITLQLEAATRSLQVASVSMAELMTRVNDGEGTLGKLTTDDELYRSMNAAVASLNELTADIRENPKRYINLSIF